MGVKKRGIILVITIVLILTFANSYAYFADLYTKVPAISGFAVSEVNIGGQKTTLSTIVFIGQWLLAIFIIFIAYARHMKKSKAEKIKVNYEGMKKSQGKSGTDLDVLYSMLREKKTLKLATIAKVFSVNKEKALDWARILENNNLASIEYPAFSDPEVELKEKIEVAR